MVQATGVLVSRSSNYHVTVKEVQDHLDIPEYPDTSPDGVLHFIHIKSKFNREDRQSIASLFERYMSKVC